MAQRDVLCLSWDDTEELGLLSVCPRPRGIRAIEQSLRDMCYHVNRLRAPVAVKAMADSLKNISRSHSGRGRAWNIFFEGLSSFIYSLPYQQILAGFAYTANVCLLCGAMLKISSGPSCAVTAETIPYGYCKS